MKSLYEIDTIFALSSGRPPAAIAVIRISGPSTRFGLETLVGRIPEARRAALALVQNADGSEIIDEALVLWFPGPKSETGEDLAELQLHGGRAIVAAVLDELGRLPGFRPAEGGEFTRRAFENGKLDLTAVEGLGDLIAAETEAQRKQAFSQLKGLLGDRAEAWRERLISALSLVEARIDFADEGDVPEGLVAPAVDIARALRTEILAALDDGRRGERLRDGLTIAIMGPPNVGKSSLLNAIARREAAIVTAIPGTTRDIIEVHLDLGGYPVTLLDTAGIRDSDDPIEQEGVRRAKDRAASADLVLWVSDATAKKADDPGVMGSSPIWVVRNKLDLVDSVSQQAVEPYRIYRQLDVSAATGFGLKDLRAELERFARDNLGDNNKSLITRQRHRHVLNRTVEALGRVSDRDDEEIIAENLRIAAQELGRLVGKIDVEDLLDRIFRDFCIGK